MKILFITYNFPRFNALGAVRTGKTAKHLIDSGHDVKVICCANQSLTKELPLEILKEKIIYTPKINVNSLIEVLLGGKKKVARLGYDASSSHLPGWLREMGIPYRNFINFPDGQIGWYPFARSAASNLILEWIPDLIFASASPYTALLIASSLSKKHKIPWIAELRDLWSDNHNFIGPSWRKALEKRLEHRTLKSACGLVTVSEPLKEILESKYNIPCKVITNGFDPGDVPKTPKIPFSNGIIRIVYTGQIYSIEQDPSPLLLALQQMGEGRKKIRVLFYGKHLGFIRQLAIKHNVSDLIEIYEPVSYKESLSIQAKSDILLLFPGKSISWKGVYTGKLFEYLGTRRPILCIGDTDGVAAKLILERSAGLALNKPEKIALQLKYWAKEKSEKKEISFLSNKVGEGFTRKEQTEKLIDFFQFCLNNPSSNKI